MTIQGCMGLLSILYLVSSLRRQLTLGIFFLSYLIYGLLRNTLQTFRVLRKTGVDKLFILYTAN